MSYIEISSVISTDQEQWKVKNPQTWKGEASLLLVNVCIKTGFFHFAKWSRSPHLRAHRWPVWFLTGFANGALIQMNFHYRKLAGSNKS